MPLDFFPEDEDTAQGDWYFRVIIMPIIVGTIISLFVYAVKNS